MAFSPKSCNLANLSVAQNFLCGLDKVVCASVWQSGDMIVARVTVTDDAEITENDLKTVCLENIGVLNTPKAILMDRSVRPAA